MASLFELQERNRRKTRIIVVCFVLFFIWLGLGLDLAIYYWRGSTVKIKTPSSTGTHAQVVHKERKPFLPIFGAMIGLVGAGVAWWNLGKAAETVLKATLARPAVRQPDSDERVFVNVVEEMCIASGLSPPRVWIIPDDDPNAFATGLKDGDYHVAVTRGLLRTLNRDELQAVVAHEIAHLKNGDTRLMTVLAVLVGITGLISEYVVRVRHVRLSSSTSSDADSDDIRIGAVIFLIWLLTVWIAPIATHLMSMMVSREREYLADASAAQFTRNPEALASALEKIGYAAAPTRMVHSASASLCIASPAAADLDDNESWFDTHPPIRKRIERLRSIGASSRGAAEFQNTQRIRFGR